MNKDYYQILGVDKNASAEDIKRAYRKMALKYHPDRGGDQQKFKEVNEAYQVLSNSQKKSQYDQFGQTFDGMGEGRSSGGYRTYGFNDGQGFEDMFSGGFGFGGGLGDIFENFFGAAYAQVNVEVQISSTQAILGDQVKFKTQQGDEIEFKIPSGTQDGQTFRFPQKGMAYRQGRGDLNVTVRVKIPKNISEEERKLYEKLRVLEQKKGWRFWKK